jgi:hypothetical protein
MDRRSFLAAAAGGVALAIPLSALAANRDPVKLAKAYPYLDALLKLAPAKRTLLRMNYYLSEGGHPASNWRAVIIQGGTRTPVPIEADGRLGRQPTLAQLQDGAAQFQIEAPAEAKFALRLEIQANIAPSTQLDAATLQAAIQQAADAVKSLAGPLALVAPKFAAAGFAGSVGGNAVLPDGRTYPLIAGRFGPVYVPAKAPGAKTVILTRAPSRILLIPAP